MDWTGLLSGLALGFAGYSLGHRRGSGRKALKPTPRSLSIIERGLKQPAGRGVEYTSVEVDGRMVNTLIVDDKPVEIHSSHTLADTRKLVLKCDYCGFGPFVEPARLKYQCIGHGAPLIGDTDG